MDDPAPATADLETVLRRVHADLSTAGVPDPRVDAELIVAHCLGVTRGRMRALAVLGTEVSEKDARRIMGATVRRASREPLQHITGVAPFRSLELHIGPGAFVPRPETELLVQIAVDALMADGSPAPRAVDLGTGSGAIAVALAVEVPHSGVWAVERSPEAALWARRNIEAHAPTVELVVGDLAEALEELDGTVAVVASNPPYIPDEAIPRDPEVRLHDPAAALYGGPDGLDVVRAVSGRAARMLRPGGLLVLEHGELQAESIRDILVADGWTRVLVHQDLTRRDRVTTAVRPA